MEKILYRINLYAHNEIEYRSTREQLFGSAIKKVRSSSVKEIDWENFSKEYRSIFQNENPSCHYNDIVGYAEVSFYNTDILITYYMNGDKNKKYNKYPYRSTKSNKIYKKEYSQGDAFTYLKRNEEVTNTSILEVMTDVLDEIENKCNEWNIYFNKNEYIEKLKCFDFKKYIAK